MVQFAIAISNFRNLRCCYGYENAELDNFQAIAFIVKPRESGMALTASQGQR
jgi:hypothetical protein